MATLVLAGETRAGETVIPIVSVTGSHGGDQYANGMISLTNGSGITKSDPLDPSTWTFNSSAYADEWMASSLVTNGVVTPGLNGKCAWASFDLGSSKILYKLWLFNINYSGGIAGTATCNIYYAVSPSVALPAQPAKATYSVTGLTPQGDYDFSSAGWTKFNTSGALTVPKNAITNVNLSGISARYIAVEILANWGDTYDKNRVGFDEVAVTGPEIFAPAGLTATPGAAPGSVRLDWSTVTNATGYNVKRSFTNSGYVAIGTAPTTNYTDSNLKFLTNYYYVVSATNINGESFDSEAVSISLPVPGTVITLR
jgi:hypothetical protein